MISRGQNNEYRADQYLVRRCGGLIYFWAQAAWVAGYVVVTLFNAQIISFQWIAIAALGGAIVGAVVAH